MHVAPRDFSAARVLPYASVAPLSAAGAAVTTNGRALCRFSHEAPGGSHSTWPALNENERTRLVVASRIESPIVPQVAQSGRGKYPRLKTAKGRTPMVRP
jgi:hypothetical protein